MKKIEKGKLVRIEDDLVLFVDPPRENFYTKSENLYIIFGDVKTFIDKKFELRVFSIKDNKFGNLISRISKEEVKSWLQEI